VGCEGTKERESARKHDRGKEKTKEVLRQEPVTRKHVQMLDWK
jgi:hypothetical protein